MRRLTTWAARAFAPGYEDTRNIAARTRIGLLEGWVSIVINTVMAGVKGALGYMTGSVSLIADAAHTFADSGTSLVVIFGFKAARKEIPCVFIFPEHGRLKLFLHRILDHFLQRETKRRHHHESKRKNPPQNVGR